MRAKFKIVKKKLKSYPDGETYFKYKLIAHGIKMIILSDTKFGDVGTEFEVLIPHQD